MSMVHPTSGGKIIAEEEFEIHQTEKKVDHPCGGEL